MIDYVVGDATDPQIVSDLTIVVHGCNSVGAWGAGFVRAVSKKWPQPEADYLRRFSKGWKPALGDVSFVPVQWLPQKIYVANLISQDFTADPTRVKLWAVDKGLQRVRQFALGAVTRHWTVDVVVPRLGTGLGGGSWEDIEPIIEENLVNYGIQVRVYDLPALPEAKSCESDEFEASRVG